MANASISGHKFGWVSTAVAGRRNRTDEPGLIQGWSATVDGVPEQLLLATETELVLALDGEDRRIAWVDVSSWGRGTLVHEGGFVTIRLTDAEESHEFRDTVSQHATLRPYTPPVGAPDAGPMMIPADRVVTTMSHPAVPRPRPLGLVNGRIVVARNFLSDFGSDVTSLSGGRLGGIEKAIDTGLSHAADELRAHAAAIGADAVVGVGISVQTVADKAQLILMVGTAVVNDSPAEG